MEVEGGTLRSPPFAPALFWGVPPPPVPARSSQGECGSLALLPGSKTTSMENGNSSGFYYEIPNVGISQNQPVASSCTPAASEDLILESSRTMEMFFSKRCGLGVGGSRRGSQAHPGTTPLPSCIGSWV